MLSADTYVEFSLHRQLTRLQWMHLAFPAVVQSLISFMARPRPSVPSAPISLLPSARLSVSQLLFSCPFSLSWLRVRIHLLLWYVCLFSIRSLSLSLSLSLCSFFLSVFLSFVSWNVTRIWLLTRPGFHLYSRTSSENLKAKGEQKLGPSFCMCAQAWLFDTQASTSGRREILAVAHSSKDNVRILLISFQRRSSTIATIWWMRKIFFYCICHVLLLHFFWRTYNFNSLFCLIVLIAIILVNYYHSISY